MSMNKLSSSFDLKLNLNAPLIINNNNQQSTTKKPTENQSAINVKSTYCYNNNNRSFIYPQFNQFLNQHNNNINNNNNNKNQNNLYHHSISNIQQQTLTFRHQTQQQLISFSGTPKSPTPSSPVTPCHPSIHNTETDTKKTESDDIPQRNVYEIVILDWDDTLFPTTSIVCDKQQLSALELLYFGKYLYELIDELIKLYDDKCIYIITNAAKEWVFRSLKESSERYQILTQHNHIAQSMNYFAAVYNSLLTLDISVISAQDLYSNIYPSQPLIWKLNAFKQTTINHFRSMNQINKYENCQYVILSIGDGEDEFTASLEAKFSLKRQIEENPHNQSEILLHRIKLVDDPSPQQMMQQMIYLKSNLKNIKSVNYGKNKAITLRL